MSACYLLSVPPPTLMKRARTRTPQAVHPLARPQAKKLRARMVHVLHAFFVREAPKIIAQVIELRAKMFKAALSRDEKKALDELMAQIDVSGFAVLAGEVDDIIEAMAKDGSTAAFAQLGIDTNADREVMNIVNREAVDYARDRSAQMVGMRRTDDGTLVPNPNAKWQIADTTRDMIRADVRQSIEEGWSNDRLAAKLAENYGFSDARAMVIARTETIRASNTGALASYRAAGVTEKQWTTAEDDRVSEECEANGAQGAIPIDDDFSSGDDAPPVHPNCRCVVVPVVRFASEGATVAEKPKQVAQQTVAHTGSVTDLSQLAAATVDIAARKIPEIKWIGNTSAAFRADMVRAVESLPDPVIAKLVEYKASYTFGERVTQVRPDLKGVHPRGWAPGTTWDSADGLANGRNIVVTETYRPVGMKTFVKGTRAVGVLAHETGHAFDSALGKITRTAEFRKVYELDAKKLRAAQRADPMGRRPWAYLLQRGEAGPSEAFAEVFAQIVTGGQGTSQGRNALQVFPNVVQFIQDLIAEDIAI